MTDAIFQRTCYNTTAQNSNHIRTPTILSNHYEPSSRRRTKVYTSLLGLSRARRFFAIDCLGWKPLLAHIGLLANLLSPPSAAVASLPTGARRISGDVVDVLVGATQSITNTLSITGSYNNGHFQIDLTPINASDNIAESVGWDGEFLRIIQRFPDLPGNNQPRDRSLAFVEPDVFSRYATHALACVLLAFADSNMLTRIEAGQELVILGNERRYPEEDNSYTVRRGPSGDVEITALCSGQEIGPSGKLPLEGFQDGFTRWTHKSSMTSAHGTEPDTLVAEYNRYKPLKGKLIQERLVTAKIIFGLDQTPASDFRPTISENSLTVMDYSGRSQLFPLNKGIVDQNYTYTLTNKAWDFDRTVIVASFADRKARFAQGIPKELNDVVHETPYSPRQPIRPRIILLSLIVISVPFAWAIWRSRRIHREQ
jgi:hypothetical protein